MTASALRGILAITAGTGLLALNDGISKHLTEHYPVGQIICLRQAFALMFLLPYVWAVPGLRALAPVNRRGQLLRASLFLLSTVLILASLRVLPLSFVTVMLFSSPLFVALLSAPLLGERVHAYQWMSIAAGFSGVLLIVRPAGASFEWVMLLPVCAALCSGLRDTYTRRLSRTDSSLSMLFWSGVTVMAAGLCTIALGWNPLESRHAVWFLAAGLCNATAHFLVIEAFRLGNAAVVAPFRYSGLLWAMLIGFVMWGEVPDGWTIAGAAVVVCAGIYMLRQGAAQKSR